MAGGNSSRRGVAGGMDHVERCRPNLDLVLVPKLGVEPVIGIEGLPQHRVIGVQEDRGVGLIGQLHCSVDVIVVAVGAEDGP